MIRRSNTSSEHPAVSSILHKPVFAISVLVLGLVLTILAWMISNYHIDQKAEDEFKYRSNEVQQLIIRRMGYYEEVIRGGVGFFRANKFVSRDDWHTYIMALDLDQYYPGIQGIGFSYKIPSNNIDSLERALQQNVYEQFKVYPDNPRDEVHSIIYLEPFDWRNKRAIGYDMYTEKTRREAMAGARDSATARISGKVVLVQETDEDIQSGLLMYIPVYRGNRKTVEERRKNLYGFVYSAFRVKDLMEGVLGEGPEEVEFAIYDGDTVNEENLLYRSSTGPDDVDNQFRAIRQVKIAGRTWTIQFIPSKIFIAKSYNIQPLIIALAGIIVELTLFYLIWSSISVSRFYQRAKRDAEANARQLKIALHKRRIAEEALKEKQRMLQSANEDLNTFIYSTSHDIKNPLTAILLHSQLAEEYETIEEYKKFMKLVNRNGEKIKIIIEMMSHIIKEEYKNNTVEVINLQEELNTIIKDFQDTLDQLNASVKIDLEVKEIKYIRGFIRSVLINLLENAVKYRYPGRAPEIIIKTYRKNGLLVLAIHDNGRGIDLEKNYEKLFKPFQRFAKNISGSGLGLFIVKRMLQKNGGNIEIESTEGEGTTFRCFIKEYGFADEEIDQS